MAALSGTTGLASLFSKAAYAADSDIADGQSRRFDFSVLQSMAHDLAKTPWGGAPRPLPDTLATMTPQAYNAIRYDEKQSLWNNIEGRQLDVQFFHMGMGFRRRVRMFSLDQSTSQAREIHFRPELFSYGETGVDTKQLEGQSDLGLPVSAPSRHQNWRVVISSHSWGRAISVRLMIPISMVFPRGVWRWIPLPTRRKSSLTSPRSGLKPSNRAILPYRLYAAGQPKHHRCV